jgi:hypothetical protein
MSRHRCTITRTQASCRRGVVIGQTLRTVGGIHLGQRRRGIAIDSRGEAAGPRCVVAKGEGRWMTGVIHVQDKAFFHYGVEVCVCWTVVSLTLLRIVASSRCLLSLPLLCFACPCCAATPHLLTHTITFTFVVRNESPEFEFGRFHTALRRLDRRFPPFSSAERKAHSND